MSPRLKLQSAFTPLVVAGSLWLGGFAPANVAARTPEPCSPDGACYPNRPTWGVYQTKWRSFPGDDVGACPTPAEKGKKGEEETQAQRDAELRGPVMPDPSKEGDTGPAKKAAEEAAADAAADPGLGPAPIEPQPGAAQPGAVQPGAVAPGAVPPAQGAPPAAPAGQQAAPPAGTQPEPGPGEPADPFGKIRQPQSTDPVGVASVTPMAIPNAVKPASRTTPVASPAVPADADAPPTLPPALRRFSQLSLPPEKGGEPLALVQPASLDPAPELPPVVRADARVRQATAGAPLGIQLINPAEAIVAPQGEEGVKPAVYFEASDEDAAPIELPLVQ